MDCEKFREYIYLERYGEISDNARRAVAKHIEDCPSCAREKERIDKLFAAMDQRPAPEVDDEWLKGARNELIARIETTRRRGSIISVDWWKLRRFFLSPALRLAYAAVILIVGIVIGRVGFKPEDTAYQLVPSGVHQPKVMNLALSMLGTDIRSLLQEGSLDNIAFRQVAEGEVEVSFDAYKKIYLRGEPASREIQDVLAYIMLNNPNDGLRIRSMETLEEQSDSLVQKVMIYSLLNDGNPGVRLKAIRALKRYSTGEALRGAYLKVLMTDENPAVRIEAVDALGKIVAERQVREVLQIAAAKDSNEYIQLLARSALMDEESSKGISIEDLK